MTTKTRVTLTAITDIGANIIARDGSHWAFKRIVVEPSDQFLMDNGWIHIESIKTKETRWVQLKNDKNFLVEIL